MKLEIKEPNNQVILHFWFLWKYPAGVMWVVLRKIPISWPLVVLILLMKGKKGGEASGWAEKFKVIADLFWAWINLGLDNCGKLFKGCSALTWGGIFILVYFLGFTNVHYFCRACNLQIVNRKHYTYAAKLLNLHSNCALPLGYLNHAWNNQVLD